MYVIEKGSICHGCGEAIMKGLPTIVDCSVHGQHVYHGPQCQEEAVHVG